MSAFADFDQQTQRPAQVGYEKIAIFDQYLGSSRVVDGAIDRHML